MMPFSLERLTFLGDERGLGVVTPSRNAKGVGFVDLFEICGIEKEFAWRFLM